MNRYPPLVIVGPTAAGKTGLAVELAERVGNCEIVSADAMAVYQGMNIGTAKPTRAERKGIAHHLIDMVDPSEGYTVADFQAEVHTVLANLADRERNAIIVGGTGLYVRAVVDNFEVPPHYPNIRTELEANPDTAGLWARLNVADPQAAAKMSPTNRRRIVRALEVTVGSGQRFSSFGPGVDAYPPTPFVQVGLEIDRVTLDQRINNRIDTQLAAGWLEEVRSLADGPMSKTSRQALGYRELLAHLRGELAWNDAVEQIKKRTRRLARRQQRWFRRDPRIRWVEALDPALASSVATFWST